MTRTRTVPLFGPPIGRLHLANARTHACLVNCSTFQDLFRPTAVQFQALGAERLVCKLPRTWPLSGSIQLRK